MRDCQVLAGGSNSANLRTFKDYTIIYLRVALLIVMAFVRFMNLSASMMFGFFSLKDKTVGFSFVRSSWAAKLSIYHSVLDSTYLTCFCLVATVST